MLRILWVSSLHLRMCYLTQRIINMIPVLYKESTKTTTTVKSPPEKNEVYQERESDFNYISSIGFLNFLIDSKRPEAQFAVHQCTRFSSYYKYQYVKHVLKHLRTWLSKTNYETVSRKGYIMLHVC